MQRDNADEPEEDARNELHREGDCLYKGERTLQVRRPGRPERAVQQVVWNVAPVLGRAYTRADDSEGMRHARGGGCEVLCEAVQRQGRTVQVLGACGEGRAVQEAVCAAVLHAEVDGAGVLPVCGRILPRQSAQVFGLAVVS